MSGKLAGPHHCVGAMSNTADIIGAQLKAYCNAHGGVIAFDDIDHLIANFKSGSDIGEASKQTFSVCNSANHNDAGKIFANNNHTEFVVYRAFHDEIAKAFKPQIARMHTKWIIEFSKALKVSIKKDFNIDMADDFDRVYNKFSILQGADLKFDDFLQCKEVQQAVGAVKQTMVIFRSDTKSVSRLENTINTGLGRSFNIFPPSVLLVNRSQINSFLGYIE